MKRNNIIILTSRFPFPLEKGDKLRIYHQIKHLAKNHKLYLISLNTEKRITKNQKKELKKYCEDIYIIELTLWERLMNLLIAFLNKEPLQVGYFYSKRAQDQINIIINKIKPQWVYSQLIRTAKYVEGLDNNVIDYMDAFSKGIERRINQFPSIIRPFIKREFYITKKYENYIFNQFKHHAIITKNDRNFIEHINNDKIHIIPNGVDFDYFKPKKNTKKKYEIVFVGNMSYPPNIEAAIYLCEKILPIIKKKYGFIKVIIGGANPHKKIRNLADKNVTISGWTRDIREVYNSGQIFVAPMFLGTGLQNKLLEAMSMGLPCVTTKLANNALLANKSQIMIKETAEEFANACIELLTNNMKYNKIQSEGFKFVKKNYDWETINKKLSDIFKSI